MSNYFRVADQEDSYSEITIDEVNKVLNAIASIDGEKVRCEHKNVSELKISKKQYCMVLEKMESMGLIELIGYRDGGKIRKLAAFLPFYASGGFKK